MIAIPRPSADDTDYDDWVDAAHSARTELRKEVALAGRLAPTPLAQFRRTSRYTHRASAKPRRAE